MEIALTIGIVLLIALWFIKGMFSSRMSERDKSDEEYQNALQENREADELLSDPDHAKRVQDHFNS